jgi:CBS domain-containing protein
MLVEDVMETELVTCGVDGTLRDAVESMLRNRVGSAIVTDGETPTGIVTETDALQAGYATGRPFGEIAVGDAMSHPLVTVGPSTSLRAAIGRMTDEGIKKLPVLDGMDLVGILTMTDVSRHYGDIVREIHAMEQPSDDWAAKRRGLADDPGERSYSSH